MTYFRNPLFNVDGYKLDHRRQFPEGTQYVYSNWTPRGSRIEGVDKVTFFGLQMAIQKRLMDDFEPFFAANVYDVCDEYQAMLDEYLGPEAGAAIGTDHIRALHDLGYVPLEFKALPEGTQVPLRVPMFTVENTHPDFYWLTNYVETVLSAELWMPMTSATTATRLRNLLNDWAIKTTGTTEGVGFQGHDFSMRGMAGVDAAVGSAMGHLIAFTGTETVPVLSEIKRYYPITGFLAGTVPASEHSVMCAGGQDDEQATYERLLELYPEGIVSVVSDTWDYWNVLIDILPSLKDKIMSRNGKLVIRPDSGDPADIICGTMTYKEIRRAYAEADAVGAMWDVGPEDVGSIELLWEVFGGTVNEQGYKVLDEHVGLIYGDGMTYERINDICSRLAEKGFASSNVVFGLGSFAYQYQTRDTFAFAMKATNIVINGEDKAIFKNPKTDNGLKKSLKGRIAVIRDPLTGELEALDDTQSSRRENAIALDSDLLTTVWKDGKFVRTFTFDEVRKNAGF